MATHTSSALGLHRFRTAAAVALSAWGIGILNGQGGALEDYVNLPDDHFRWEELSRRPSGEFTVAHLSLTSQQWHGHRWQHHLQVVSPAQPPSSEVGFLLISGDGDGTRSLSLLKLVAERAGIVAAVVTSVPNQPLYDGRKEDALIAYTFDQYLKSGDATWPLLFPMVKSAVRAMDALGEWSQKERRPQLRQFVVSGMSKRGWTTWLTGATDPRVVGLAPMVIDMLNMQAQTQWAEKVYGRQSDQIHDYTDLGLVARMDDPPMKKLRDWVDPFSYRQRYKIPKLLLLGTNDPYWTVDSLRHYWDELPEPKLVFQTPNAGHNLAGGTDAFQTLAAFAKLIALHQPVPKLAWQLKPGAAPELTVTIDQPAQNARLWTASSNDRDFRNDQWSARTLTLEENGSRVTARLQSPAKGYQAYMVEVVPAAEKGHGYKLSTQVFVLPDNIHLNP